jgi:hypothetical protein
MPGCRYCGIDILSGSLLDGSQDSLIIRIDDIKGVIFDRVNKLAIDEKLFDESKFGNIHVK